MFADDKAKMSERSSYEKIQKQLDLTIPVNLLPLEDAIKAVSKYDKLTQLRILLMIQSVAITDNQFDQFERKITSDIAGKLGVTFDLPQEASEMAVGLLYKFASIDGVVPEEEKSLLTNLLGGDEKAFDKVVMDAESYDVEKAIEKIASMKEVDKSILGFFIQQIISADDTIGDEESALIKKVFESTSIDALCIPEKTGFWKRIFG
jgi:uncharacterized tellurite resistance protein B-like protein